MTQFAILVGWVFLLAGSTLLGIMEVSETGMPAIALFSLTFSLGFLFFGIPFIRKQLKLVKETIESRKCEIPFLSNDMISSFRAGKIQYVIYLKMTCMILLNSMLLGAAFFISHYLMDFWIHGYDNYVYHQLGQDSHLFDMIDYSVWATFIIIVFGSLFYFGIKVLISVVSIGYVILDCLTRPISGWIVVSWAVLSVIVFAFGVRIIYSGLVLEIDMNLQALMSLCLLFSSGTVFWFASIPSITIGKGPENTIYYFGLKESLFLFFSGFIMLFTMVTNATSFEDLPIDSIKFTVLFAYNILAMHWMWKRY